MRHASGQRWTAVVAVALAVATLLGTVYVLSVGPVAWLDENGHLSDAAADWIVDVYRPVFWLEDHTLLKSPLSWYGDRWVESWFNWRLILVVRTRIEPATGPWIETPIETFDAP
jgi:hypothetical protein